MTDGPSRGIFGPQDYSDFGPAHGFGKKLHGQKASVRDRANILFGDGHVGVFIDKVRNGEFNIIRNSVGEFIQEDLDDCQVFDGVLMLGRRNRGTNMDILE
jgi:prepilin-type processing-associated H-X9-DG protein